MNKSFFFFVARRQIINNNENKLTKINKFVKLKILKTASNKPNMVERKTLVTIDNTNNSKIDLVLEKQISVRNPGIKKR